jgi:hypothetical protein
MTAYLDEIEEIGNENISSLLPAIIHHFIKVFLIERRYRISISAN